MQHETMAFDVVIVGGGPSGLTLSIRLAQLAKERGESLDICLIDKGASIGAHILSGAVLEPRALNELLPHWQNQNPPMMTSVTEDQFLFLTKHKTFRLPTPPQMQNDGNFIISLGDYCQWLASVAENLGVNIFPGFAAADVIVEDNVVRGIITGDKGLDRFGKPKAQFQAGIHLRAKQTILAEGCRGSLTQKLFQQFNLRAECDPQTYGIGIKEVWEIPEDMHQSGKVMHTIGWPLDHKTYGGSFAYQFGKNLLSIGFVVGLDYHNPYLNPYEEFQRFKTHALLRPILEKSKRIAYGARTLVEGGLQAVPKLTFPGGLIVGDAAGFLNVPKIKGIHTAMKSALVAAESLYPLLKSPHDEKECHRYTTQLKQSWLWDELKKARNIRPAMNAGLLPGILYAAIDTYIFRGNAPWTFRYKQPDHLTLRKAANFKPIDYPKHDHQMTFDLSHSLFLANVSYDENQPYHLKLKDRHIVPIEINYQQYASPETRYCPAGVYEIVFHDDKPRLHINGGNCIHCKACDIKDPTQNIVWTPSEGGSGPDYNHL